MQIQQMAFVLVALFIFFGIVALFYLSFQLSSLKQGAANLENEQAKEVVRKLSSTPEFTFTSKSCPACIDLDKLLVLKERKSYEEFWDLGFLQVEKIYPTLKQKIECTRANYPNCNTLTLIQNKNIGTPSSAFVSLCYWTAEKGGYYKCELGIIYASGEGIND